MILVETLEDLVHHYLEDPHRPGSAVGKVNAQDLVGHVMQHLADRGVDIGFTDGSRLTLPGSTARQPQPPRHRLPLVLQDNDGHVRIYCDGRDCVWSWPLYQDASPQTNGEAITNAVQHAIYRHSDT
jgi:hypothetical protein